VTAVHRRFALHLVSPAVLVLGLDPAALSVVAAAASFRDDSLQLMRAHGFEWRIAVVERFGRLPVGAVEVERLRLRPKGRFATTAIQQQINSM
jgi:hypothetical protein